MLDAMTAALDGKVKAVRLSEAEDPPVCIISEGALSLEMEKVLSSMPNAPKTG